MIAPACHRKLWVACLLGFVSGVSVLTQCISVSIAQDVGSRSGRTAGISPIPDYTHVTGYLPGAILPVEQPRVVRRITPEIENVKGRAGGLHVTDAEVAEGILYFGVEAGYLFAMRVEDLTQIWAYEHGRRISTKPSVDKNRVYFGAEDGISAVNRETGELAWQFPIIHGANECTPLPVGNRVYMSGYDGCSYALDAATGEEIWKHDFSQDAPPDPPGFAGARARFQEIVARPNGAATDGKLFIQCVFDQSRVIALDCQTGKRVWTFQAQGWISPEPTIAEDRVYVASQDKHLYCLDRESGKQLWSFPTPSWLASRAAVYGGKVYLPHHGGRLYELDAASGKEIRMFQAPADEDRDGLVYTFPIIAGKTIYLANSSPGTLHAFDLESGRQLWRLQPEAGSELFTDPVIDGKRIFVSCRSSAKDKGTNAIFGIGIEP
jgi:outer membrane protein assembly factor BamB